MFSDTRANPASRIYRLKREVLELYRAIEPLVDPIDALARGASPLVHETTQPYFRDVHDHLERARTRVHDLNEALTSVLTANLTQITVRQNEDVRTISAWAAIIAVPTAVTGVYGMNFEHMPELTWTFGYPLVLAVIGLVCFALWRRLRRVGWL
ncbi:MAG: CorA family divalent cation transporter [Gaiellaceae bacterium]